MQQLHYLRQVVAIWEGGGWDRFRDQFPDSAEEVRRVLGVARSAPKFVLPAGGRIFNDDLKGVREDFRLPYESIVLEYPWKQGNRGRAQEVFGDDSVDSPKRIVIAEQLPGHKNAIRVYAIVAVTKPEDNISERWTFLPYKAILWPQGEPCPVADDFGNSLHPRAPVMAVTQDIGSATWRAVGLNWRVNAAIDLADEVVAVMELIEALSCDNVTHEALPRRKLNRSAEKRGALPFDEYRSLVVLAGRKKAGESLGGTHRSPREHLRRGHIRRLGNGSRIWINNTIVNAGVGGVVHKRYEVKAAA